MIKIMTELKYDKSDDNQLSELRELQSSISEYIEESGMKSSVGFNISFIKKSLFLNEYMSLSDVEDDETDVKFGNAVQLTLYSSSLDKAFNILNKFSDYISDKE